MLHRSATERSAQIAKVRETAKKGGRHVAMAALSLGRKRPRRAYAAGHAAPQQYRGSSPSLQVFSSSHGQSLTEFGALWHSGQDPAIAIQTRINSLYQWYKSI